MRIVVDMLFYFECLIVCFHHHSQNNIQRFGGLGSFLIIFSVYHKHRIVGVFHPCTLIFLVFFYIHTYHWTSFASLINHKKRRYSRSTCHVCVVCTKCRCDMDNSRTIFCSYIVARNYTECLITSLPITVFWHFNRFYPRNQLLIFHANKVSTFVFGDYFKWNQFISCLIVFQFQVSSFGVEKSIQQSLCQNNRDRFSGISVIGLHSNIINFRSYTKCCIWRQCPRSSCPCYKIGSSPLCHFRFRILHLKLSNHCRIFYVTITTRLIQFVRT